MIGINSLDCCGIDELVDIADYETEPETIIKDISINFFENENQCAFFMFSDIQKKKSGKNLCKYIKKHKLGLITESPSRVNPNSGNSLTIWIWTINKRNLRSYYSKNCKD